MLRTNNAIKYLVIFMIVIFTTSNLSIAYTVSSNDIQERLEAVLILKLGSPKAFIGNKAFRIDSKDDKIMPVVEKERTLVPVRFIAESFGAGVFWDGSTDTITISSDGKSVSMKLGSADMMIGQRKVVLEVTPKTINGRAFIPLRAMAEALGKNVFYKNGLIIISDASNVFSSPQDDAITAVLIKWFDTGETNTFQRLKVMGDQIITPEGEPIELRGLNWGWWGTAQPQDAKEAVMMGANVIRMPIRWYFTGKKSDIRDTKSPGHISPEGLKQLDQYIDWCAEQKLWVVLFGGSDQGAGDNPQSYWTNPGLRKEYFEMWEFIVERYKDKPYIAAYELLSEPHPKKPATSGDLLQFYEEAIDVVRAHDKITPVMIGANDHYDINLLEEIYTEKDKNIIYTFNYYLPMEYCKTDKQKEKGLPLITYPGTYKNSEGEVITLDKNYLSVILKPAIDFRNKHQAPVFVNQVGVRSEAPGHLQYMNDVLEVFYQNHIAFTYWTYRTESDATQHGLYWEDSNNVYHPKMDQIELLKKEFLRR